MRASAIAGMARRRPAKMLYLLASLGLSFGFIAAVIAIAYASWFRLPPGVEDQGYMTVVRQTADGARTTVSHDDFERISALVPEVSWFYVKKRGMEVRDPSGAVHMLDLHDVPETFFDDLGVTSGQGRLAPAAAGATAVILSDALWRRLYGGAGVAGTSLLVEDGPPLPIVGVAPPAFAGVLGTQPDAWLQNPSPDSTRPPMFGGIELGTDLGRQLDRRMPIATVFGVVPEPTGLDAAMAKARNLFADYRFDTEPIRFQRETQGSESNTPNTSVVTGISFSPGTDDADRLDLVRGLETAPDIRREVVQKTTWLLAIVGLLLVMVFVSVVEFLMAENASREGEQRVRIAVGAAPGDIFRRTVAENGALVGAIALLAFFASGYLIDVLLRVEPFSDYVGEASGTPRFAGLGVALVLLAVAFLVCMAYVSWFASRASLALARSGPWLRRTTRQVLLLVGTASLLAVLSLGSRYLGDARLSLGFANTDVSIMTAFRAIDGSDFRRKPYVLVEIVEAVPGIESAALAVFEPLVETQILSHRHRKVADRPDLDDAPFPMNHVTSGFFSTLGVELLAGRVFEAEANEVVVSQSAADALGGFDAVLGSVLVTQSRQGSRSEATVVGVVADVPYDGYGSVGRRMLYSPYSASATFIPEKWLVDAEAGVDVGEALRQLPEFEGWEVDRVGSPASIFREQFLAKRSVEIVLSAAAAFALLLAFAGVANSLARAIGAARSPIGVRFALGATPGELARAYVGMSLRDLAVAGAVVSAAALAAKLAAPAFAAMLELWLIVPSLVGVAAMYAMMSYVLVGQLAARYSVNDLVHGLGGDVRPERGTGQARTDG